MTYLVRSVRGRPVASFDSLARALDYKRERAERGVRVRIWEVITTETEYVGA